MVSHNIWKLFYAGLTLTCQETISLYITIKLPCLHGDLTGDEKAELPHILFGGNSAFVLDDHAIYGAVLHFTIITGFDIPI